VSVLQKGFTRIDDKNEAILKSRASEDPAVRASVRGKKISAVRVWEALGLRPSPVMVWTPVQLGAFLDVAAQHRTSARWLWRSNSSKSVGSSRRASPRRRRATE
jgi:hypothetical protein